MQAVEFHVRSREKGATIASVKEVSRENTQNLKDSALKAVEFKIENDETTSVEIGAEPKKDKLRETSEKLMKQLRQP